MYDTVHLPPALNGERCEFQSDGRRLSMYVSGAGSPLLLIHSVNAAASAAEVRPLYEHYSGERRVYALDLPGYGFSDRSERPYTIRVMTDAVQAAIGIIRQRQPAQQVDALALSLSCEFLARAALENSGSLRSLALVSPTGFSGRQSRRGPAGASLGKPWLHGLLRGPGWGKALFGALTRRPVIRYFLQRTWGRAQIDQALLDYDVLTARQPGAEHAPLYFLSAALFSADIHDVYEKIALPVWMSHGVRGDFTDYRNVAIVRGRSNWRISSFATGALPHFEQPEEFCRQYDSFLLSGVEAR